MFLTLATLATPTAPADPVFASWGDVFRAWGGIVRQFWLVALAAFLVALIVTPIVRKMALSRGIVDQPDEFLKPHGHPIPYLGGVAIFAGWATAILLALWMTNTMVTSWVMVGVALAGFATMLIGLFDDLRVMPPLVKLACNIGVAVILICLGIGDDLINVVTRYSGMQFSQEDRWLELMYSVPVTIVIVVAACNATNLIDGLDGLCSGVLGIISIGFVILAVHLRVVYPSSPLGDDRVVLAMGMLGAALGFLPYNVNPAKIFMGDAGSMLLGFNAAVLLLMFGEQRIVRWMIGATIIFGLPVADMLLAMARRWRNGRPIMIGDRSHYYDQLRDRGLSVRRVAAISYVLALAFVIVGTSVIFIRTRYAVLVFMLTIGAVLAAIWRFNMAGIEKETPATHDRRKPFSPPPPANRRSTT
ncbi:MAG TPA: MraY family glycosyltransferase [Phycisphaerae bacterium]|nr:MraY family glycosyltransferase [Phycisphaerae bacterium]